MTQNPVDTVTAFYSAVSTADADAIGDLIDAHFADDAAIEWPPSLPHGGRITGARKLRGLFSATARPDSPTPGPANLVLVRAIGDSDEVVAWLTFDWADPATGVLGVYLSIAPRLRHSGVYALNADLFQNAVHAAVVE